MTLDAKATQARYLHAVKRRVAASACYRQARMVLQDGEEKDYADQLMARLIPELSAVETFLRHEAAYCCDETEQAKERARQQKDVAKAMGKGKA